jgi:hypothetical protein
LTVEKEIRVKGKLDLIWTTLLNKLSYDGYKITNTVPQTQMIAEKGSKLVSSFVGGTKGGYRTVAIAINPTGIDTIIKFVFTFSALGVGVAYQGAKDEIDKMIQDLNSVT